MKTAETPPQQDSPETRLTVLLKALRVSVTDNPVTVQHPELMMQDYCDIADEVKALQELEKQLQKKS